MESIVSRMQESITSEAGGGGAVCEDEVAARSDKAGGISWRKFCFPMTLNSQLGIKIQHYMLSMGILGFRLGLGV